MYLEQNFKCHEASARTTTRKHTKRKQYTLLLERQRRLGSWQKLFLELVVIGTFLNASNIEARVLTQGQGQHIRAPSVNFQLLLDHVSSGSSSQAGKLDIVHRHSSTFAILSVNNTPISITKLAVFFHTSQNGQQALHEVQVGALDKALGLNMTRVQGVVLEAAELAQSQLFSQGLLPGFWKLLKGGALWFTSRGVYAAGACMEFEPGLRLMTQGHVPRDTAFIRSAARLLILDTLSGNHDRDLVNCYMDAKGERLLAVDNGGSFDHAGFSHMDLGPSLLHGPRQWSCLPHVSKIHDLPAESAGISFVNSTTSSSPSSAGSGISSTQCLVVQEAVQYLESLDLDSVGDSVSQILASDLLIQWYLRIWELDFNDERRLRQQGWVKCMEQLVGQNPVRFYQERVQGLYPLPKGRVCGVDVAAFWANIIKVRARQFMEAGRRDLEGCRRGVMRPAAQQAAA